MARIENHKYSIEEAFRECFYIVPDYQREYVWTDKEVHQLLEDIDEQLDAGSTREYFIGMVLVAPTEQKNQFEVIDGQQRLTTFFLLLCVLRHIFRDEPQRQAFDVLISTTYTDGDGETQTSLKLNPRYENAGEVMSHVVEFDADPQALHTSIQAAGIPRFGSIENLISAYSTIYRYVEENYSDIPKLKKYWGHLANNVVFIQISTDVSSALKIFETINERGVGLNPMDLLKNLLFAQVEQAQFTQLKDEWKKITKPLEKDKEKPLRFLRYFLMANYAIKNKRGDAVVREDEIYDWFVDNENAALCDYSSRPREFVRKVIRSVELYLYFRNGFANDGKPSLAMDNLRRLTGGAFSLHYVLLLAAAGLPKSLFEHFVAQLESFLFYYIFTKTPTKELERNFSQWADELRNLAAISDPLEQKDKLDVFVSNRFDASMASKKPELADALKRLSLYTMQKYRIRYLLARLTQHVDMQFKGVKTLENVSQYTNLQIEHILPQTPAKSLLEKWTIENPTVDYNIVKNRLGNLTLLEKPINIVAGNDFYVDKLVEYVKSGNYLTRSLADLTSVGHNTSVSRLNEKLVSFRSWDSESIEKRQLMLSALVYEVWRTKPVDS